MNSSKPRWASAALVALLAGPSQMHGQTPAPFPPKELKNIKVLPAGISVASLVDTMAGFTRALGVKCAYCHAGNDSVSFTNLDFPSDDRPEKTKAREMLRMVAAINGDYLTKLANRRQPQIVVTCATCHHGITQPRPLDQVLIAAYDSGGADALDATYRRLRQRYYGAAAYDFGEVALVDVANALRVKGNMPDALRVYRMNIEMAPTSGFALRQAAGAELAAGDTAAAIDYLQRAVTLNANDQQSQNALTRLKAKPPAKPAGPKTNGASRR